MLVVTPSAAKAANIEDDLRLETTDVQHGVVDAKD